jgi:hypothetical protein
MLTPYQRRGVQVSAHINAQGVERDLWRKGNNPFIARARSLQRRDKPRIRKTRDKL